MRLPVCLQLFTAWQMGSKDYPPEMEHLKDEYSKNCQTSDLALEVTQHTFCHIPLVANTFLKATQIQREGK